MLSDQTPFTDMLNQENLQRMSINRALIPVFANVMKKWQIHFDKKGYLGANNYALLLEEVLLNDSNSKFNIDYMEIEKRVAGRFVAKENLIAISNNLRESSFSERESVLSHELLHLITLTYFYDRQNDNSHKQNYRSNSYLNSSSFLREGFTEGLNKRIYNDSDVYVPHVKMVGLLNYVLGKEENFYTFLNGYTGLENANLKSFIELTNAYHKNFYGLGYEIGTAIKDPDYIMAQNYLIDYFKNVIRLDIEAKKFIDVNDYISRIYKIKSLSPVKNNFLDKTIENLHSYFIVNHFKHLNLNSNQILQYAGLLNVYMAEKLKFEEGYLRTAKVSGSVLDIYVDIFEDKFKFKIGDGTVELSRNTPFNYAQTLTLINSDKSKSMFTLYINNDNANGKLNFECSYPVFSKASLDLKEIDSQVVMSERKTSLNKIYSEFNDLMASNNDIKNVYEKFASSKNVREVCFENPKKKYFIEEEKNGSVKIWYDNNNKLNFSEIKDINDKLKTRKVSKPKSFGLIPNFGYTYNGCELVVNGNEKIFVYVTEKNELSLAMVNQDDKLEFPDSLTYISKQKNTKYFDDKTL